MGVYRAWADCQREVKGFSKARFKKFATLEEAEYARAAVGEIHPRYTRDTPEIQRDSGEIAER